MQVNENVQPTDIANFDSDDSSEDSEGDGEGDDDIDSDGGSYVTERNYSARLRNRLPLSRDTNYGS